MGNATNVIPVIVLSIQFKICCIWTKVVVSTRQLSPRVKDLGRCSLPNVHSLTPPSPTAQAQNERALKAAFETGTHIHLHVCSGVLWTQLVITKNTKPGSWRSSARYPQRPPPDVEDPIGPQLSTLLSFGERWLITHIPFRHIFPFLCL